MLTMRDVLVEEERRREILHRAAYGRFIQQVTPANTFKCLLCIRLGQMFIRLGRRLQARYVIPAPTGGIHSKIWLEPR